MIGRTYFERGQPVAVLIRWATRLRSLPDPLLPLRRHAPRNVLIERADGTRAVRPFRGLRKPKENTMAEPARAPGNDFERWLASSRVPPDQRDPEALCEGISAAITSRDFEAVTAMLTVLALKDPRRARRVYDMILAACDGDERRAVLLAVLGD